MEANTIRGDKIGKRANDWYVWVVCPECKGERWALRWKLKLPNFTGLCQLCNAIKHPPIKPYGDKHPRWKNGVMMTGGYAYILNPNHPKANAKGYVRRSHLVLEERMGRPLSSDCLAHHLNGVKDDDRPSNLIEIHKRQHQTLHAIQRKIAHEARREVVEFIEANLKSIPETNGVTLAIYLSDWQAKLKEWGIE